jgi:hypothetical protein
VLQEAEAAFVDAGAEEVFFEFVEMGAHGGVLAGELVETFIFGLLPEEAGDLLLVGDEAGETNGEAAELLGELMLLAEGQMAVGLDNEGIEESFEAEDLALKQGEAGLAGGGVGGEVSGEVG